jgi:peptide/nickel transport system substrate-binding protein
MDEAQSELNVQRARADMNNADNIIWSIAHSLILYQRPQYTAVKENLANIGSWGFQSRNFATVGFTG